MSFFGRIGKVEKFRPGSPGASPRELFFLPDSTYISRIDGENSRFIKRTLSTESVLKSAIDIWQKKQYQPNFEKEFAIVVNFISKKGLKQRFRDKKKH